MAADGDGSMTLVLSVRALQRLARPAAAVDDASRWSRYVGVVGEGRGAAVDAVERAGTEPDFVAGEAGTAGSLSAVRQRFPTDRHVFVSPDDAAGATAKALGWEYLPLSEAAEKAGWELAPDE